MKGTIYNRHTGQIISTVEAPDEAGVLLQCTINPDYEAHVGAAYDNDKWYFLNGEPTPLNQMELKITPVLDVEELEVDLKPDEVLRVENIPAGADVVYPGGVLRDVNDGFIEWSCDEVGSYYIGIFANGYAGVKFNAVVR